MTESAAADLDRLAGLLKKRDAIDSQIAEVIDRPALIGHVGEFIAARIFDIKLAESAAQRGYDGCFASGALIRKTVNVKWYPRQEGLLDLHANGGPDFYLVLAGPKGSSGRGPRPLTIDSVHLFEAAPLLRSLTVPIGVATSVKSDAWDAAEIYPGAVNRLLLLTAKQRSMLGLFGSTGAGGDVRSAGWNGGA